MRSYIRESRNMGNGKHFIRYYTLEEDLILSIIKFVLFLFCVWPLQLMFWVTIFCLKCMIKLLFWMIKFLIGIISLPFKFFIGKMILFSSTLYFLLKRKICKVLAY